MPSVARLVYLWAFEGGRTSPDFPALPPSSMNAVLALSFITLFLLASGAFAIVAVREHMQRAGPERCGGHPGLAATGRADDDRCASAARTAGIAILSERSGGVGNQRQ